jgi:transcription elongation factor Elf1
MNQTDQFISSLEDFELSFLKKYKLKTYLESTQQKILNELVSRNLNDIKQEELILKRENNKQNSGCPRCNSQKIRTDQINLDNDSGAGGYKIAYMAAAEAAGHELTSQGKRVICEICGLILEDDNKKNLNVADIFANLMSKLKSKKTGANNR